VTSPAAQEVAKRLGEETLRGVGADAGGAVALREPGAVRAQNQRHVRKHRRRSAQRAGYSSTCFGVFDRWSAPRITWVMRISMSSTTAANWLGGQWQLGAGLRPSAAGQNLDLLVGDFA